MVGTASKKENSTTAARDQPSAMPPRIVEAEREVPGMIASDWDNPMKAASRYDMRARSVFVDLGGLRNFSKAISARPPSTSAQTTTSSLPSRCFLMTPYRARPITAVGMKATITRDSTARSRKRRHDEV